MKLIYTIVGILLLSTTTVFSQLATIQGKLVQQGQGIGFIDVLLYKKSDTINYYKYTNSNELGEFVFESIDSENYQIKINGLGYRPISYSVDLNTNRFIDLGVIEMENESTLLDEVMILGQKQMIKKTATGLIVETKESITQSGGSALDLLKNIPTVLVDAEGALSIRGKNPLILINGRTSGLTNINSLTASSIERVEIINNPDVKYDASSDGGIINITLKKSEDYGTNFSTFIGAGAGVKARESGGFTINNRSKKVNTSFNYDIKNSDRIRKINASRVNFLDDQYKYLNQKRQDDRVESSHNLKFNLDYNLNNTNQFNIEVLQTFEGQDNNEFLNSTLFSSENLYQYGTIRHSREIENEKVNELSLMYTHQFKHPNEQFILNYSRSKGSTRQNTSIDTNNLDELGVVNSQPAFEKTHFYETPIIKTLTMDYERAFANDSQVFSGIKITTRSTGNDYLSQTLMNGVYKTNPDNSNFFQFNEQVNAVYLAFETSKSEPLNFSAGIRVEQTSNKGFITQNSISEFRNNYIDLFPNLNIGLELNDNNSIGLSIGKRINRPILGMLNPFIDVTDVLSPHGGNPNLKPEMIHSFELNHSYTNDKFNLNSSFFYRDTKNLIQRYTELTGNVALTIPMNIEGSKLFGFEEIIAWNPLNIWSINSSLSLFNQTLKGKYDNLDLSSNLLSYYGKLTNTFLIGKKSKVQIVGVYNSPTAIPQGKVKGYQYVDLGYQTKLFNDRAALGIVISDLFDTQNSVNIINSQEFSLTRKYKVDTRAVFLTFAYSFTNIFKENLIENRFSNN